MNIWWMREHASDCQHHQHDPQSSSRIPPPVIATGLLSGSPQGNYLLLRVIPSSSKNAGTVPPAAPDGWRTPWWERPGAAKIITGC